MKFQISNFKFQKFGQLWLAIIVIFLYFGIANRVFASQAVLQLSPFLIHENLQRGQNLAEKVVIINSSSEPKYLTLSLNDFLPAGTDGETQILPVDQWTPTQTSLASWITIQKQPKYSLFAGEFTEIDFTISVPINAEDGAHYGALLFTLGNQLLLPGQTQIRQQSATLVIIDVGRGYERGAISSFGLSPVGDQTSQLQFSTTFHNSGSSSLQPKGKIIVNNIFGKQVAMTYINSNANIVLPNTDRIFISHAAGNFWGRYTAVASVTFGSNRLQSVFTITFWVWPSVTEILWGALYLILILAALIFLVRRYNEWLRSTK